MKAIVHSHNDDTEFFDIVIGILQTDIFIYNTYFESQ